MEGDAEKSNEKSAFQSWRLKKKRSEAELQHNMKNLIRRFSKQSIGISVKMALIEIPRLKKRKDLFYAKERT